MDIQNPIPPLHVGEKLRGGFAFPKQVSKFQDMVLNYAFPVKQLVVSVRERDMRREQMTKKTKQI